MNFFSLSILAGGISFVFSLWVYRFLIRWYRNKKVLAEDMNKAERPKVPGFGGLGIVLAFLLAVNVALAVHVVFGLGDVFLQLLLPSLLAVVIMAFVGFVDDVFLFPMRPIKPVLALFAAIPLMAVEYDVHLPIFEQFQPEISWVYPVILIPLLFIFTSNAINIMADFDGLVPGNGVIMSLALLLIGCMAKDGTAMLLAAALLATLLVFYVYNRFPSKLFAGNVGTLFVGAMIAVIAIIAHAKIALFILLIPYIVHFLLQERIIFEKKTLTARPRERGIPAKGGVLTSEYAKSYGLTHFLMRHGRKMTEKKLVRSLMLLEGVFAILAVVLHAIRLDLF